jgi:hypothetical protein
MNVILKKVPKWGSNFFFTFPTSEGSDLLSSHVMQTPTFISKLSDGNVIFRLDVGKSYFRNGCKIKRVVDHFAAGIVCPARNWLT